MKCNTHQNGILVYCVLISKKTEVRKQMDSKQSLNDSVFFLFWQPELVRRVEKDLLNIMAGGTTENADILHTLWLCFSVSFVF